MGQKFHANKATRFVHPNGAIAYGPGGPFDCLGLFAKVQNCPIDCEGLPKGLRLTCYATGYADTYFSVPACTRYKGQYIGGYFSFKSALYGEGEEGIVFVPYDRYKDRLKTTHAKGS